MRISGSTGLGFIQVPSSFSLSLISLFSLPCTSYRDKRMRGYEIRKSF
jgi:hypothetical protein